MNTMGWTITFLALFSSINVVFGSSSPDEVDSRRSLDRRVSAYTKRTFRSPIERNALDGIHYVKKIRKGIFWNYNDDAFNRDVTIENSALNTPASQQPVLLAREISSAPLNSKVDSHKDAALISNSRTEDVNSLIKAQQSTEFATKTLWIMRSSMTIPATTASPEIQHLDERGTASIRAKRNDHDHPLESGKPSVNLPLGSAIRVARMGTAGTPIISTSQGLLLDASFGKPTSGLLASRASPNSPTPSSDELHEIIRDQNFSAGQPSNIAFNPEALIDSLLVVQSSDKSGDIDLASSPLALDQRGGSELPNDKDAPGQSMTANLFPDAAPASISQSGQATNAPTPVKLNSLPTPPSVGPSNGNPSPPSPPPFQPDFANPHTVLPYASMTAGVVAPQRPTGTSSSAMPSQSHPRSSDARTICSFHLAIVVLISLTAASVLQY